VTANICQGVVVEQWTLSSLSSSVMTGFSPCKLLSRDEIDFIIDGSNIYQIISENSGYCLNVDWSSSTVDQWACGGSSRVPVNNYWYFI